MREDDPIELNEMSSDLCSILTYIVSMTGHELQKLMKWCKMITLMITLSAKFL